MGFTLTDVLLFGKAQSSDVDSAAFAIMRRNILRWGAIGGYVSIVVHGVSPLVLPDAIANSLSYVKAFGGTEQGLPDGYTQLEYIQSTGTQYIDTGLKLTQDNTVEVEYNYHTASNIATSGRMFGARYTSSPRNAFAVGTNTGRIESSTKVFAQFDEIISTSANNITIGQWNTYKVSIDGFYIDDVLQGSFSATTFETPFTVKLFAFEQATNSSGTPTVGGGVGRCRRFKVYQGDVLVMDLIPAKNPTNDIGMYDLIRGQFFTNAGTGDFIAGAPVDPVLPTPDAPMDIVSNNGVLKARHQSGLPWDYTLLEYIQSTGTQYIDTGLKLTQDNTVEVEYNYHTASSIATSGRMFGARYTSSPRGAFSVGSDNGYASSATRVFGQFGDSSRTALNNIVIGQWDVYKLSADGFYIDDVRQESAFPSTTFETPFTVKLFAFEQASSSSGTPTVGGGVGRCRRFKVYQGDTLVMDLIPAKNPTDDIGMYDLIRGQFFTNQGTGDFVAGATVNDIEVYADGTVETIEDTIGNTATAEMLLKVGDYQDEQEILSGVVTRKVGVLVLDGTENWSQPTTGSVIRFAITNPTGFDIPQNSNMHAYCNILVDGGYQTSGTTLQKGTFSYAKTTARYLRMAPNNGITTVEGWQQWLADQYAAGTPVIVVFPLATPTTESVAGQALQVTDGDNVLEITQASLARLELEAQYNAAVSLTIQEVEDANLDNNVTVTIQ